MLRPAFPYNANRTLVRDARTAPRERHEAGVISGFGVRVAKVVSSVFFGYSAELIADWCGVSVRTALRWKHGQSRPPPPALKLFELHRDRRILGPEWDRWLVNSAVLVDPEGNATTQGQLRAYFQVYQLCHELMRGNEAAQAEFDAIVRLVG